MLLTASDSKTELRSIVAKSRTLAERLSMASTPNSINSEAKTQERFDKWCQIVAGGDFAKFRRRLAWAGLNIDTIRPLLIDHDIDSSQHLPPWATTLDQVIEKAKTLSHKQRLAPQRYLKVEEPVPFEQIYLPYLQVAQEQLLKRTGKLEMLTDSAQAALERQLLLQLEDICTATLMTEFSDFRSSGDTTRDFILFSLIDCTHQEKYYAFIEGLFADGLLSLFKTYPVLGRLIAMAIDFWVDATGEFCDRLTENWLEIEKSFSSEPLKQVIDIKSGLSDPHNGCRTVAILTFDTGMKLVYKPKNLKIEAAFFQLLDWFNHQDELLPLKIIQVLNYDTHGWVEYVESLPCKNETEAQQFYQRSGMLLSLLYLLHGSDCHYDNLIAHGGHPVLIDTETLFQHRIEFSKSPWTNQSQFLAQERLRESPLQTVMLPQWGLSGNDNLNIDLSGLGGREEQVGLAFKWQNINTDGMKIGTDSAILKGSCGPTLNGIILTPDNYYKELLAGFEQMYSFLSDHQEFLSSPKSPLNIFANLGVRYLFRSTRIYESIVRDSYSPESLKSGIDRSIALDVLSRAYLFEDKKPDFWPLLDTELQAVEQLDIPFISTNTSETSFKLPSGEKISGVFEESSFSSVFFRLKSLNKDNLEHQLEIIRSSFCARYMVEPSFSVSLETDNIPLLTKSIPLTPDQLVHEAINLAQDLQKRGIYADQGVTWIGLGSRIHASSFQIQSLSNNLYDGSPGVALFLAALAKVTGNPEWRDLTLKTLQPLRLLLKKSKPEIAKIFQREESGGAEGLGSIVYSLVQISQLINDVDIIEDAKKAANLITLDQINYSQNFDLVSGSAGTILAYLKLYEVESSALENAIACGERILEHEDKIDKIDENINSGFAHGTAGIAYALLRLFQVTQDLRFSELASRIISFEQDKQNKTRHFDLQHSGTHPSATNSEEVVFHNNWTNGAAGIGLGRLGSLSILNTDEIHQEIERHLITTQKHCLEDIDNLAWGNLGRIETIIVASQKLKRPELLDFGLLATTNIVKQAQLRGRFNLASSSIPKAYNPGFFHGTTGIGYQLLRIAYPDLLPSILLWE